MKMKKLASCMLAAAMLMTNCSLRYGITIETAAAEAGDTFTYEDFECTYLEDGTIEISDYDGNGTKVVIPEEINGTTVTSIGKYAFGGCSRLASIEIPDSVTSIGEDAFFCCYSLASIEISENLTNIGQGAFWRCSRLTSIKIPDSVTRIEGGAFTECSRLISIEIPDGVTSIGNKVFWGCSSLTSIIVKPANKNYSSENGILYNANKTSLICCPSGKKGAVQIPDSVTSIGEYAFGGCSSLTSIKIPDSVTSIGREAFYNCSSLTSIEIPDGVTHIETHAFLLCSSLTSIKIPDSVTSIEDDAFGGCSSLTSIEIPNSVTSIGEYAFGGCSSLTSIEIPDSVTGIGDGAFWECSSLTSIEIPDSVTSIGKYAFWECSSLTSIEIPDSVTGIGREAFWRCSSLTSIEIPNSVTSIEDGTFSVCSSLADIYYSGKEEEWNEISILSGNDPLLNATIHYNSHMPSKIFDIDTYRADIYLEYEAETAEKIYFQSQAQEVYDAGQKSGLADISIAWDGLINILDAVDSPSKIVDIAFEKKDMYMGMIFDILEVSAEKGSIANIKSNDAYKMQKNLFSYISDFMVAKEYIDTATDITSVVEWSRLTDEAKLGLMEAVESYFKEDHSDLTSWNKINSVFSKGLTYAADLEEYCQYISSCVAVYEMSDSMKSVVDSMYEMCPSNNVDYVDLKAALKECVEIIDSSSEEFIELMINRGISIAGKDLVQYGVNQLWSGITKQIKAYYPYAAMVSLSYKSAKYISDTLFGADAITEAYCKLGAVLDVGEVVRSAYGQIKKNYINEPTRENALILLNAVDVMFEYMTTDIGTAKGFVNTYNEAWVSKITQIMGRNNTEELLESFENILEYTESVKLQVDTEWIVYLAGDNPEAYLQYKDAGEALEEEFIKKYRIACPVDIYIYNKAGEIVASVINGTASCRENEPITIACVGDEKEIWFYEDETSYTIKYVGTDDGKMDVQVTEYSNGEPVRYVYFDEVALKKGVEYESEELGTILQEEYQLLQEEDTVSPDLDTMNESGTYTAVIKQGFFDTVDGSQFNGVFCSGEMVEISAAIPENAKFLGWTSSSGDEIFEDTASICTRFRMPDKDISIMALYEQTLLGDVDQNGVIDYFDAIAVLQYDAELLSLSDDQLLAGDVNGDGSVDSFDAVKILQYDAELVESFE